MPRIDRIGCVVVIQLYRLYTNDVMSAIMDFNILWSVPVALVTGQVKKDFMQCKPCSMARPKASIGIHFGDSLQPWLSEIYCQCSLLGFHGIFKRI